jgi:protein gp37
VRLNEAHLLDPLKWRTSQIVATGYHGDWGLLSDSDRDRMLAAMALCPQHTFLTLTKRPERLVEYLTSTSGNTRVFGAALDASGLPIAPGKYRVLKDGYGLELVDVDVYYAGVKGLACFAPEIGSDGTGVDDPTDHHVSVQNTGLAFIGATGPWPLPNVYLGTSVSNQPEADERLPYLMKLAAAGWKTWLSIEPMVGAVDLGRFLVVRPTECTYGLSWVVIGGESGPNARDVSDDAIRSVVKECQEAQVPVYVKQLTRGGKRVPFSEWPEDLKVQQTPWEAR